MAWCDDWGRSLTKKSESVESTPQSEAEDARLKATVTNIATDVAAGKDSNAALVHRNRKLDVSFVRLEALLDALRRGCENVLNEVAPDDEMVMRGHKRERPIYFYGGRSALKICIDILMRAAAPLPRRILDFPCGHGRALRFLRAAFPAAELFAGDINESGLKFCADRFGATTFLSEVELGEVSLPQDMDLILCASLITHFSQDRARQLIDMLIEALAPGGILIFTSHGRMYERYIGNMTPIMGKEDWAAIIEEYQKKGYGYRDYAEYRHIKYGVSMTSPKWIFDHLHERDDLTILSFSEKAWHAHQDVTAVQKKRLSSWYDVDLF